MNILYTFDENKLLKLLLLQNTPSAFFLTLGIYLLAAFLLYVILFYILRPLMRRFDNSPILLILSVIQNPLIITIVLLGIKSSVSKLNSSGIANWIQRGLTGLIAIALTYCVAQLFTQVVTYYLRIYTKQSEAVWDNVLVPILERLLPALTYILGTFLFLEALGIDLTGIWVAFGGLTFVLGFALRDILANFFSGLVLLIDTPFEFGDVIAMPNNSFAVIKNIGLRVTKLYLVDSDAEIYIPNASLGSKDIINLSRPTPHVARTIQLDIKVNTDQILVNKILRETVLGHPDTLGKPVEKLKYIDDFQGLTEAEEENLSKTAVGKERLQVEEKLDIQLQKIERKFKYLIRAIQILEKGGLNEEQIKIVQNYYNQILELVGLQVINDDSRRNQLVEFNVDTINNTLIGLIRIWYQAWLKDPDLRIEDERTLEDEWESKLNILKNKVIRLAQRIAKPGGYETLLDEYALNLVQWLQEEFKSSSRWKEPAIRLSSLGSDSMQFTVKFYVDHIKLEHWERSERVANEVRREMVRRLTEAGVYNN
ncbi:mechanosensitive ion channel family protein [Rivularia sp. UHCC 0363]|uniref:mechanosensitive ion channel family protein n=1 Tax=Rivularia sp. UHCC 0363 TaxID=3110244 RepID=UPI002B2033C4|nr:mechanosensitive ion channel family protein [Rivularia sp. UHCC 0363]MEA5594489.1 mechanosensitive ion channel family protein [Rivularia sp. UHCC 0363]